MRHLSVPSDQTQVWLERCRAEGWLGQSGVVATADGYRAIPLNESAPGEGHACWNGFRLIDVEPLVKGPTHWKERLPETLRELPDHIWPTAYEIQGDVLMVKLEGAAMEHKEAVGKAMLDQLSSVRLVCADDGVMGDFRVRSLEPLASRGDDTTTQTEIREHGHRILVDPGKVYFSSRLSRQAVSYTHLRAHETEADLVCRLLLE